MNRGLELEGLPGILFLPQADCCVHFVSSVKQNATNRKLIRHRCVSLKLQSNMRGTKKREKRLCCVVLRTFTSVILL